MSVEELTRTEDNGEPLKKELGKHAGQWVATLHDSVVAASDELDGVLDSLEGEAAEEATVFRVPTEGTIACFYRA
jgi:hypothetical protein